MPKGAFAREDAKAESHHKRLRESAAASGSGHSPPHLENCTGKTFRNCSSEWLRFQSKAANENSSQIRLRPVLNSLRKLVAVEARSSEEERRVDAKALIADEGRDKLRKAAGSCK